MTKKLPLLLTLAALAGFAAPTLAADHGAKPDPQAATTTAKPKTTKQSKAAPKGRHAKSTKAKSHAKTPAATPVTAPAAK